VVRPIRSSESGPSRRLGLEALRREKISQAKFLELAERVGVPEWIAQNLLVDAGIDDAEAQPVLLPE